MTNQTIGKEELRRFYNDVYSKGDIRDNEKLYKWVIKLLRVQKEKKLLDIACGGGWLLKAAEESGLKTSGLDISEEAVKRAKMNAPHSEILSGDGQDLHWQDNHFDYVTCLGSLEHYINPEIGAKEIRRVLATEGTAIVMLPNSFQLEEIFKVLFTGEGSTQWQIVERLATKKEWKNLLEKCGLTVTKIFRYNKYPEFFVPGTYKIKSIRKFLIASSIRYLSPFNFAQHFVYVCKK